MNLQTQNNVKKTLMQMANSERIGEIAVVGSEARKGVDDERRETAEGQETWLGVESMTSFPSGATPIQDQPDPNRLAAVSANLSCHGLAPRVRIESWVVCAQTPQFFPGSRVCMVASTLASEFFCFCVRPHV